MSKTDQLREYLESRIGCPYVMGGTGSICTPDYRAARMAQYPDSAANIRKNCPRLSGSASSCKGCKWAGESGTGKRCYDCAQLMRWAYHSIGIELVSGATSQWKKTPYVIRGEIQDMPVDKMCLVFRESKTGMSHVGHYMGDGTVIHAKGSASGVVREALAEVNVTHYMLVQGLYADEPKQDDVSAIIKTIREAIMLISDQLETLEEEMNETC